MSENQSARFSQLNLETQVALMKANPTIAAFVLGAGRCKSRTEFEQQLKYYPGFQSYTKMRLLKEAWSVTWSSTNSELLQRLEREDRFSEREAGLIGALPGERLYFDDERAPGVFLLRGFVGQFEVVLGEGEKIVVAVQPGQEQVQNTIMRFSVPLRPKPATHKITARDHWDWLSMEVVNLLQGVIAFSGTYDGEIYAPNFSRDWGTFTYDAYFYASSIQFSSAIEKEWLALFLQTQFQMPVVQVLPVVQAA